MKRFALPLLALLLAAPAAAQDWKEALKKVATAAADQLTGGQLTRYALIGDWDYTGPGVKFEGEDLTAELSGAALETAVVRQLEKAYACVGIRTGACSFRFGKDENFTARLGKHTLTGTYAYDAETHVATLHFAKDRFDLGSIPGRAYISGSELLLVFPVTELVGLVTALGSKVPALSTVASLLSKYKNVYVGFAFARADGNITNAR